MTYRENGAIGALLDEYQKAIIELRDLIDGVSIQELNTIVDHKTKDLDCLSIQTILLHVLRAGYGYADTLKRYCGEENIKNVSPISRDTIDAYKSDLRDMFIYNEKLFLTYPEIQLEEHDPTKKMKVSWGQYYDVEQLMEHAIVHILRHRRQIERFLIKLRNRNLK